jgi:hypothetical protein
MNVLCKGARVEELMDFYTKYVPNVYIPEIAVYMEILQAIEMYDAYEYLPQIWSDLVEFELARKDTLTVKLSFLMAKCDLKEPLLQEAFCLIAKEMIGKYHKILSDERQIMMSNIE